MLKEEFLGRLADTDKHPTNEEYKEIEFVYNFHPCIDNVHGKDIIAELWRIGGIRLIRDMYDTAVAMKELYEERDKIRNQLEENSEKMYQLAQGNF